MRVYAEVNRRRPGAQVDDDTFIALEHPAAERSHLWMSAVAPLQGPRFVVNGTRAGFATDGLDPQEAQLADGMRPGEEGYGVGNDGLLSDGEKVPLERGAYERFYEAWFRHGCAARAPRPWTRATAWRCCACSTPRAASAATNSVIELEDSQ